MYIKIKRCLDILISAAVFLFFWWLFLLLALMVIAEDGRPVFFKQRRIGKDKKEFFIYKFRTMKTDTPKDVPTHLLEDPEKYITKIGKFLRKTSLDELPQLYNILKGDMSLVGPRPALYNQYDLIAERDKYGANALAPGLTGLAQVNGRDELPIKVKAEFDGVYTKNISFFLDLKIIFKTIGAVIKSDGVKEGK